MLIWKFVCMLHHTQFLSLRFPDAFWCALKTALGNSWKSFVFKQLSVARNKASMLAWSAFNVFRIKAKPQNVLHSCFIYNPYFHTILSLSKQEFSQPTLTDRLQLSEFLTAFFNYFCASGYLLMVTQSHSYAATKLYTASTICIKSQRMPFDLFQNSKQWAQWNFTAAFEQKINK